MRGWRRVQGRGDWLRGVRGIVFALAMVLGLGQTEAGENPKTRAVMEKINIPKVEWTDVKLSETLEFLGNVLQTQPEGKEVNFFIWLRQHERRSAREPSSRQTPEAESEPLDRVTLTLDNVPLLEVLKYVTDLTNCVIRWDPQAIVVRRLGDTSFRRPGVPIAEGVDLDRVLKPLQEAKVPSIDFRGATAAEAFDFLAKQAKTLLPAGQELKLTVKTELAKERLLTLAAHNLSLIEALRYVTEFTDLELSIEPEGLVVSEYVR